MSKDVKEVDTEEELLNAFKVFDKDGSGTISSDELRNVLKSLGENLTDDEVEEMVKLADRNGDGHIDCKPRYALTAYPPLTQDAFQTRSLPTS